MAGDYKKEDIEILVATMDRIDDSFLKDMFPFGDFTRFRILVVNQTSESSILQISHPKVTIINSFERGLSMSRNLAIENATGRLGVITDDDVVFKQDFAEKILAAYNSIPDAAMISFRTEDESGNLFKKYPSKRQEVKSVKDCLNIMSVEMVFNLPKMRASACRFDERFGLGAVFGMGEESIFIKCLLAKGLTIFTEPETIVIHPRQSTHTKLAVADKYYIQGAFFSALFADAYLRWVLIKMAYELKQRKLRLSQIFVALNAASSGRKDYLKT